LSSIASGLSEKLTNFRGYAAEHDQICLVYATVDRLTPEQPRTLDYVRAMGRDKLGTPFDVSAISVRTIYDNQAEETELARRRHLTFELNGHLTQAGNDLLVDSVSLTDLYSFLKAYRTRFGTLDLAQTPANAHPILKSASGSVGRNLEGLGQGLKGIGQGAAGALKGFLATARRSASSARTSGVDGKQGAAADPVREPWPEIAPGPRAPLEPVPGEQTGIRPAGRKAAPERHRIVTRKLYLQGLSMS
jgi:hypothetical protein